MNVAPAIARARRLAAGRASSAGALLARIAHAEASEQELAKLETASLDEAQVSLLGAGTPLGVGCPWRATDPAPGVTPMAASCKPAGRERRGSDWLSPPAIVGLLRLADALVERATAARLGSGDARPPGAGLHEQGAAQCHLAPMGGLSFVYGFSGLITARLALGFISPVSCRGSAPSRPTPATLSGPGRPTHCQ